VLSQEPAESAACTAWLADRAAGEVCNWLPFASPSVLHVPQASCSAGLAVSNSVKLTSTANLNGIEAVGFQEMTTVWFWH
jgi:hypothetical protein